MNKTKRYNFLYIIMLISLLVIPVTFSRYTTEAKSEASSNIAKWQIIINNEPIVQNTALNNKIDLIYDNKENGLILPGETGYFDIVLDPSGTEVSLKYNINIDLSNLPSNMRLTGYTLNSGELEEFKEENKLSGEIRLKNYQRLDDTDKQTYRVYWKWNGDSLITADKNYFVNANINVRQIIE